MTVSTSGQPSSWQASWFTMTFVSFPGQFGASAWHIFSV